MKKAMQTAINIIVSLFILFRVNRMSKCQKNKYFIGSCGTQGPKAENKEFNQSFAKLMAARDAQDSQIQGVVKPEVVTQAIVEFKVPKGKGADKKSDIDLILQGDF